jgi:hypothetical protein
MRKLRSIHYFDLKYKKIYEKYEILISHSASASYYYAVNNKKERFLLGERSIKKSEIYCNMYETYFGIKL